MGHAHSQDTKANFIAVSPISACKYMISIVSKLLLIIKFKYAEISKEAPAPLLCIQIYYICTLLFDIICFYLGRSCNEVPAPERKQAPRQNHKVLFNFKTDTQRTTANAKHN